MPAETRYARTPRGDIAYQVLGDSPIDLVYVSGATNIDVRWESQEFAHFQERLASFSRLILFDRRGSGASDGIPLDAPPTWEEFADDLRVVLDTVGSSRTALFANLDGGPAAILFAATQPARVSALVLANTTAKAIAAEDYPAGLTSDQFAVLIKVFEEGWGSEQFAALTNPTYANDPRQRSWFAKYMRASASPRAYVAQVRAIWGSMDVRAALASIRVPTLILHRRELAWISAENGRYLSEHIPGSKLVELDGSDPLLFSSPDAEFILDTVEEFLTGVRPVPEPDRVLAAVLFTDLVDSTRRAAAIGDRAWHKLLDAHDQLAHAEIERNRGLLIKTTGDGILARFDSPGRAIRCAAAMREQVEQLGLEIRAGIHAGEVELRGDDVGGIAVVIASRVSSLAKAGEVLVSRTVADLVAGSGQRFRDRGMNSLKGVPGEWQLFEVDREIAPY